MDLLERPDAIAKLALLAKYGRYKPPRRLECLPVTRVAGSSANPVARKFSAERPPASCVSFVDLAYCPGYLLGYTPIHAISVVANNSYACPADLPYLSAP